jgi:ABC-type uncharacterized transport system permease subunit
MNPESILPGFAAAAVRAATPLAFAAAGELLVERAGVINIGIEGMMVVGAYTGYVAAHGAGQGAGLLAGAAGGAAMGLVFAALVVGLRVQQVIAGTALSMLGLALTASLHRAHAALVPTDSLPPVAITRVPLLADVPVLGPAFFAQPMATYLLYVVFPVISWMLYRSIAGVALRATGESPMAVVAAGHSPARIQSLAIIAGGALAGTGGAILSVVHAGTFVDGMTAGRGFVAVAIVALGRWTPLGVATSALVFGAVSAVQYLAQSLGWRVPYPLVLAAPYAVTLVAMAVFRGHRPPPSQLGKPLRDGP